ncbi:hypothetical protein GM528_13115, partial [Streptococcus pneumoniae]|nr:hypothetical protein [Streptococcus pneumoniae]
MVLVDIKVMVPNEAGQPTEMLLSDALRTGDEEIFELIFKVKTLYAPVLRDQAGNSYKLSQIEKTADVGGAGSTE